MLCYVFFFFSYWVETPWKNVMVTNQRIACRPARCGQASSSLCRPWVGASGGGQDATCTHRWGNTGMGRVLPGFAPTPLPPFSISPEKTSPTVGFPAALPPPAQVLAGTTAPCPLPGSGSRRRRDHRAFHVVLGSPVVKQPPGSLTPQARRLLGARLLLVFNFFLIIFLFF